MSGKFISFVFDDGPGEPMCAMIDKIASYGWRAGFAIVGKIINDETEGQLRYAIRNGFELVSHSQNHISLASLSSKEAISEELMGPIIEVKRRLNYDISFARLPYISYNDLVLETVRELKLPLLGQGIKNGKDWSDEVTPETIAEAVLSSVSDGAVACLHVTENTSNALDIILAELRSRGYALVTTSELFRIKNIENIPLGVNIANVNSI